MLWVPEIYIFPFRRFCSTLLQNDLQRPDREIETEIEPALEIEIKKAERNGWKRNIQFAGEKRTPRTHPMVTIEEETSVNSSPGNR
jgi:hypothetical protein